MYRESIVSLKKWKEDKFRKPLIVKGARAKDFELAIQWLVDCGLLLKSHRVSRPGIPLAAYHEISVFRLFQLK